MAYHTFASILVHYVFSTKNREPLITEEMQPRLWAYMGGIARTNNIKSLAIGGMPDHVHLLLSLHPSVSVDQVRLFGVDARSRPTPFRMADWIRRVHDWHVTNECNRALYRQPEETPHKEDFC